MPTSSQFQVPCLGAGLRDRRLMPCWIVEPPGGTLPNAGLQWDDIRLLLAVASQGSFAKAARQTGVSLSTIGRRLRALEQSLGVALVERRSDGHRLTAQAQALVPAAGRMAAAAGDLHASVSPGHTEIRILAREWEALFLIRHLQALQTASPDVQIEIGYKHWPDLTRWEADLVVSDHSPTASNIVARKLGRMAFAIYAGRDYAAGEPHAFSDERYVACAWVGFTPAHRYFATEQWLASRRPIGPPSYRFDNAFMVLEAVRSGIGLGLLPVWLGERDRSLIRVSEVLPDLIHATSYLLNADLRHEPRLRAVADAIAALFRRQRRELLGEEIGS
jgi:molybdate transport repressor ModE-like protein